MNNKLFECKNPAEVKSLFIEGKSDIMSNPNFKKWFGKSKVVDKSGNPLVVYHGSSSQISIFNTKVNKHGSDFGEGAYFTADMKVAKEYGSTLHPVYLKLENPYVLEDRYEINDMMDSMIYMKKDLKTIPEDMTLREYLIKNKFDGVIIKNPAMGGGKEKPWYVVYTPQNIKSATGNNGEFNPKSNNINESSNKLSSPAEIEEWIKSLTIPARKPRAISKTEHGIMLGIADMVNNKDISSFGMPEKFYNTSLLQRYSYLRLDKEEYEAIYGGSANALPSQYEINGVTYIKSDATSLQSFKANVDNISEFLTTLRGFHRLVTKNLTVEFVTSKVIKTPAKYSSDKDRILINPLSKKVGNTVEEYGSLRYIVLHELGHRYLAKIKRQSWNIEDPSLMTTKYSERNPQTMSGEEIFAELFALSHWKKKYKQFDKQIDKFLSLIE